MRITTWIMLLVASINQPFSEIRKVTCDLLLEIIESKLDEGLSSLDGDKSRLARKTIAVRKTHGSVKNFVDAELRSDIL